MRAAVRLAVAGLATWSVLYSYQDDVALDLALLAKPGGDIVGKSFTIELKRYRHDGGSSRVWRSCSAQGVSRGGDRGIKLVEA